MVSSNDKGRIIGCIISYFLVLGVHGVPLLRFHMTGNYVGLVRISAEYSQTRT